MTALDRLLAITRCLVCAAGVTSTVKLPANAPQTQPPVLIAFVINDSSATVNRGEASLNLTHAVAGLKPLEYRVSARADFANALWLPYTNPLRLTGWQGLVQSGSRCEGRSDGQRLQLFLQVRAELGSAVHIVNGQRVIVAQKVESNVVSDAICVVGDR